MTKIIMYLIQYLVLISIQMVSQIAIYDDLNDEQTLKRHVKKVIQVKNYKAPKELNEFKKISK
ncbi:hypothetical protein [Flavobacterium aestivum]|uniref:hypothetical protein n=1 Tax=Flavobacterium aestivum TaxID=3003257 RepID=UPI002285B8E1|nr:hypothetical protein [Flavobacterium aestivum]